MKPRADALAPSAGRAIGDAAGATRAAELAGVPAPLPFAGRGGVAVLTGLSPFAVAGFGACVAETASPGLAPVIAPTVFGASLFFPTLAAAGGFAVNDAAGGAAAAAGFAVTDAAGGAAAAAGFAVTDAADWGAAGAGFADDGAAGAAFARSLPLGG